MTSKNQTAESSRVISYAFRLKPGQDLKLELARYAKEANLKAAAILSGVGSLQIANLRLANGRAVTTFEGPHEIVSMTGTLSADAMHVHLSVADLNGKTVGGHLMEGNLVYTTCEIVLIEQLDFEYVRVVDPTYGYPELVIRKRITKETE
jgi:predicted DNA-binding protein with PD1-like motif